MGLRDVVTKLLSSGSSPAADPDEFRDLVVVSHFEAPGMLAELEAHGLDARSMESFNVVTKSVSDVRILVCRRDLDDAAAVLDATA